MQNFHAKFDGDLFYTPMGVVAKTCRSYEIAKYVPPSDAKKPVHLITTRKNLYWGVFYKALY